MKPLIFLIFSFADFNIKKMAYCLMRDTLPSWEHSATYVPLALLVGTGVTMMFPAGRKKLKKRWEVFTSPNHANPLNQGPFHYRTFEEEKRQSSQSDKGVHFTTAFLMYRPMSIFFQYAINGISRLVPSVKPSPVVTKTARYFGAMGTFLFGWMEEYVDGFEKDEGFSVCDMIANTAGLIFAVIKEKGYLQNLYFFATIHRPPSWWKYHFWLYMPSWEFTVYYDLTPHIYKNERKKRKFIRWYDKHFMYNPFLGKFRFTGIYEITVPWQRK